MAAFPAGFLPASYALLAIHILLAAVPAQGGWLWWIGVVAIWLTLIQWPFYFLWVAISPELSVRQKVGWGVIILLGNMFAMPYFLWCKFRRRTVPGLLAIIGRQRIQQYLMK